MSDKNKKSKLKETIKKSPLLSSVIVTLPIGLAGASLVYVPTVFRYGGLNAEGLLAMPLSILFVGLMLAAFVLYPLVLTGAELYLLFDLAVNPAKEHPRSRLFDLVTVPLGLLYSYLYLGLLDVKFASDWPQQLANSQQHTPIYTQSALTVWVIALAGFAGYLTVSFLPLRKTPPLLLVLGMSAMYLGTVESILWGVQIYQDPFTSLPLLLLPLNCLLITARTILSKIREWERIPHEMHKIHQIPFLRGCSRILDNARVWPLAAFLLMWPLLGILIAILILFGQAPDSVIRAWTETSGWNLSRRMAPQNVYYDEHYLCTVAAGGHRKIVKPLRLGMRHGHEVIVNRQLCVANAFEQVLEERTPRLHRALRNFYDKYGFPVARCIRSPYAADLIYYLMKPLEWFFLAVLYLTDVHPEDRIAVQYMGGISKSALSPGCRSGHLHGSGSECSCSDS
nr:DUF6688 family protein [uncultured Acetatifactor sp.]